MSSFGQYFRVTTFGESHCRGVGAIVDGVPPRLALSEDDIMAQLSRRRPGQSKLTTARNEDDQVQVSPSIPRSACRFVSNLVAMREKGGRKPQDVSSLFLSVSFSLSSSPWSLSSFPFPVEFALASALSIYLS